MTTTLVTGAGQIGSLTAALLAGRGEQVMLLDRKLPPAEVRRFAGTEGIECLSADVTDYAAIDAICERHRVTRVVHTAALLSTSIRADPLAGTRVNVLGTANLLEIARLRRLERLVIASSTTVTYPVFGSYRGDAIPEDFPMRVLSEAPASIYAATKLYGEHLAGLYRAQYAVPVVALRYAAVVGAWPGPVTSVPGRLIATLIDAARRNVPAVIDDPVLAWSGVEEFVDARDCARANIAALDAPAPGGLAFHIAAGETLTMQQLVDAVRVAYPALEVGHIRRTTTGFAGFPHPRPAPSDLTAAARELAFTPRYRMTDTVRSIAALA